MLAIIGGTGLTLLEGLEVHGRAVIETPFGAPSGHLVRGELEGHSVVFLARHGERSTIPPHRVNYRANLWALKEGGAGQVLAVNAVGGIRPDLAPGALVVPHQLIDYTWGRRHTFFEDELEHVIHVDFTEPYCPAMRQAVLAAGEELGIPVAAHAVYGATQGPRLETGAEVDRLERDGCDIVGMTGMPEAGLARELGLCYGCLAVVANAAAGRGAGEITMREIDMNLARGMHQVLRLLNAVVLNLGRTPNAGPGTD